MEMYVCIHYTVDDGKYTNYFVVVNKIVSNTDTRQIII